MQECGLDRLERNGRRSSNADSELLEVNTLLQASIGDVSEYRPSKASPAMNITEKRSREGRCEAAEISKFRHVFSPLPCPLSFPCPLVQPLQLSPHLPADLYRTFLVLPTLHADRTSLASNVSSLLSPLHDLASSPTWGGALVNFLKRTSSTHEIYSPQNAFLRESSNFLPRSFQIEFSFNTGPCTMNRTRLLVVYLLFPLFLITLCPSRHFTTLGTRFENRPLSPFSRLSFACPLTAFRFPARPFFSLNTTNFLLPPFSR